MAKRGLGRVLRVRRLTAVAAVALTAGGCTALDNALAMVPFFSFMRESPGFDPYEAPRNAPPNAVPFASPLGAAPEAPLQNTDQALRAFAVTVANPFPMSDTVVAAGREAYMTHCYVCHGDQGQGNGPVTGPNRFPYAPSLLTPTARDLPDGYIYGIVRVGRGLMQAYGARVPHNERWYIVNYVRYLQQQAPGGAPAPAPAQPSTPAPTQGRD